MLREARLLCSLLLAVAEGSLEDSLCESSHLTSCADRTSSAGTGLIQSGFIFETSSVTVRPSRNRTKPGRKTVQSFANISSFHEGRLFATTVFAALRSRLGNTSTPKIPSLLQPKPQREKKESASHMYSNYGLGGVLLVMMCGRIMGWI
jgi:hypothetical protein